MSAMHDQLVRKIALEIPGAVCALEAHHLDYCCGGWRTLREACAYTGVALDAVVADIENQARHAHARGEIIDLATMSIEPLIHRIVTHHALVTREVARLQPLARKVVETHGDGHVQLRRTVQLVESLCRELRSHQLREERTLFPYVAALDRAIRDGSTPPTAPFASVERPIEEMEAEHESMSAFLEGLRASCDDFLAPKYACASWSALYQGLEELERDLERHVHLENNVLFPRARELEARLHAG